MEAVLDRLRLGDLVEPDAGTLPLRVADRVGADVRVRTRDPPTCVKVPPRSEPFGRRLELVGKRLGLESGEPFGILAVGYDLEPDGHGAWSQRNLRSHREANFVTETPFHNPAKTEVSRYALSRRATPGLRVSHRLCSLGSRTT